MRWIVLVMCLMATPVFAVEPDEILDDPVLETRARSISADLRCLVCRNESIDESNAGLARDLRLLVRERLVVGDSDDEVIEFVVDRYGEYVLLKPNTGGSNLILWLAGPLMLLFAGVMAIFYLKGRSRENATLQTALTEEELARLQEILKD